MGRERAGYRKHFFIYIAFIAAQLLMLHACTKIPAYVLEKLNFQKADALLEDGEYAASLAENKRILTSGPVSLHDRAVYRIGLIYIYDFDNPRSIAVARAHFNEILKKYPESPLKGRAELWIQVIDRIEKSKKEISVLRRKIDLFEKERIFFKTSIEKNEKTIILLKEDIKELKIQIEGLKQIDLGLERKKRKGVP